MDTRLPGFTAEVSMTSRRGRYRATHNPLQPARPMVSPAGWTRGRDGLPCYEGCVCASVIDVGCPCCGYDTFPQRTVWSSPAVSRGRAASRRRPRR